MENIKLDINNVLNFVSKEKINAYQKEIMAHNKALIEKTGKGNDFLGWTNLPTSITDEQFDEINEVVSDFKNSLDFVVVIGIGGSYLGSKAVIDALSHSFKHLKRDRKKPIVLFAGQNISEDYLHELREILKDWSWGITVISKSGTTTEPAIAFRILKADLEKKYGKEGAGKRIIAITDKEKGALRQLANEENFKTFVIDDDIGGRFSVLTPVGLVPIAAAGFDIKQLIEGARAMENATNADTRFEENLAAIYAATRNALYKEGKKVEILVNYHPKLQNLAEWWKQLYGESEGKEHKGIFPASVNFTTDLHSLGQYIQDGERTLFETVISVAKPDNTLQIPGDEANLDKLNYIAGKRIDEVNKMAELGTMIAHVDGGVPNIRIEIPQINEYYLGQLIYFFEKACGISGYVLDVNPFDQPGVEDYKRNMFALLEKPGFEKETKVIKAKVENLNS